MKLYVKDSRAAVRLQLCRNTACGGNACTGAERAHCRTKRTIAGVVFLVSGSCIRAAVAMPGTHGVSA